MTRAKRVLGEAVLQWLDADPDVPMSITSLVSAHMKAQRDHEVVAWAVSRTACLTESMATFDALAPLRLSRRPQPADLDAVAIADWRRSVERARIVLGGAVLHRVARRGDRPFPLSAMIQEDLVRGQDVLAVKAIIQGIP